ncbi:MAG: DUF1295 domain-containing protein, partial [Candidatus Eisenbacteria bacterium]|nr:DUF1295 domain-containing protein [Candidatus Eisenbacteria bacterium]
VGGPVLFRWSGRFVVLQIFLLIIVSFLFVAGARNYDMRHFLGLRQMTSDSSYSALTASGRLKSSGILAATRHPWYLAAMIFIWVDYLTLDLSRLIANIILTGYLFVGTILEERKLILEYGEDYRQYQRDVSMLFPLKYVRAKLQV